MLIPPAGGAERQLAKLQIERDEREIRVAWSPDGEWIASSDKETPLSVIKLVLISATTGRKRKLVYRPPTEDADLSPPFSPDGRYLAFARHLSTAVADIGYANLYTVEVETGSYRALTTGTTNDSAPSWSHDGKWIYFQSGRNGGPQIWRIPAEGGPASQVTKNGGGVALESVNGKLLFYSKYSEPGLWMLPLDGGIESQVLPSLYSIDTFAITKAGIYFACRMAEDGASLGFMSFSPRFIKEIARIKSPISSNFAVSPDGSSLLYEQADQTGSDLMLVENFK